MNLIDGLLAYVAGPAIVTFGTVFAAKHASKGSKEAAEVTAKTTEENNAINGYHQLVTDLREDVNRLRTDHNDLRQEHEEIKLHVKRLEDQAVEDKSLIRYLIDYIRVLRSEILRLGGIVPEPPADLDERMTNYRRY